MANPQKSKPPGSWCLTEITRQFPIAEAKCQHKTQGQWLVFWDEKYYFISPSNNLQKDLWVGEARRQIGEDKTLNALRWLCHECGTIQIP